MKKKLHKRINEAIEDGFSDLFSDLNLDANNAIPEMAEWNKVQARIKELVLIAIKRGETQ